MSIDKWLVWKGVTHPGWFAASPTHREFEARAFDTWEEAIRWVRDNA